MKPTRDLQIGPFTPTPQVGRGLSSTERQVYLRLLPQCVRYFLGLRHLFRLRDGHR